MERAVQERLRDRFRGCMVGLAVGDALGMPVEMMTAEEIREATGGEGITGYVAPIRTKIRGTRDFTPGQWTDDTQLALAVARSLLAMGAFNLDDMAHEHVVEYHRSRCGWGRSTTLGLKELAEETRHPGDPVLDPKATGMGNGIAMKVAPLALYDAFACDEPRDCEGHDRYCVDSTFRIMVKRLASLTHRDPCATKGAVAIAAAVRHAVLNAGNEPAKFREPHVWHLQSAATEAHWSCPTHGHALADACYLATQGDDAFVRYGILRRTQCDVRESVPFVLGICRVHLGSFRDGVLAAVNAGGDTDSNAAMVGAILGAYHGLGVILPEWVEGLEAHDEILMIADRLFDLAIARVAR